MTVDEKRLVGMVQDMVGIESHYLIEKGETKVGAYIEKVCKEAGLEVSFEEVKDGRNNCYVTLDSGKEGKTLLYCGHLDTVRPDGMTVPPFTGEVKDGRILGRGSVDMKGGVSAMLYAMMSIKENKVPFQGKVIFAGTVGEECPDSSEGGMLLGKKGKFADMAVVGEATKLNIAIAHKGTIWLKVSLKGQAAHGSMPHLGDNAIYKCTEFVEAIRRDLLPKLDGKSHPLCGKPTLNIGRIEGGMQNNIVPDACYFSFDRRYIPGEKKEDLYEEIYAVGESIGLKRDAIIIEAMEETAHRGPMETDREEEIVKALETVTKEAGVASVVQGVDYWTDGSHLRDAGIPTVVFGPGDIKEAHSAHEYIEIDSLVKAADCYTRLIIELLGE